MLGNRNNYDIRHKISLRKNKHNVTNDNESLVVQKSKYCKCKLCVSSVCFDLPSHKVHIQNETNYGTPDPLVFRD